MKFLCDNCKAKYQISDEKVAGKTVRMKCRKCGHQIEVRAEVTETSVATNPPKPILGAPTAPRPPQKPSLATSLSATKPKSSSTPASALAGAFKSNIQEAPASIAGGPAPPTTRTRAPDMGGIELSVTDEWYVAINGVPVGPVRISELRRKAASGAVTEESLCWQEGLEEWRPIRSIAELAALVREAAQGGRPSLMAPEPPPAMRAPSIPAAPRAPTAPRPSFPESHSTPPAPATRPMLGSSPSAGGRSNVVPLRPAASSGMDDLGHGFGGAAAAFARGEPAPLTPAPMQAPLPTLTPKQTLSAPMVPLAPAIDPFAVPPPPNTGLAAPASPPSPAAPLGSLLSAAPYRESVIPPPSFHPPPPHADAGGKKGVPLWFWPILVLALGFGGGIAFLVFRPQPPPQPVVIQMPQATPTPTPEKNDTPPPAVSAEPTPPPPETKGKPVAAKGSPPRAPEEKKGLDLGGLGVGGGGPNVGPGGSPGGSGAGLDQAGVERVVANHRQGVKRTCWERGGSDQKSSVNVVVSANVAPNGAVTSTSSTGDDPVVAKCIEGQVRTWTFPAPSSNTTINIPFKFVRQ
jgi:predicted Zn finger-like uncharacterized protein